ncbi:hypothetical protein GCM10025789_01260 [Tessaracoccus lubricantis]|uniref:THIF-type NAD/FAD binding fold domain-containing protein n=1 Tax=Tessaracoccus lubricantis TaxID=545543 RepID=A0ABP9EWR1_9ACTN
MNFSTQPLTVLGSPARTAPIAAGLQRAGMFARTVTPRDAHRSPGTTSSSALAVLTWAPGRHPVLESEIYGEEIGALHVWWDAKGAAVGPYVAPGFGPCPACLASRENQPAERGTGRHLTAWAASWAALQAMAVLQHGTTDLMGSTWTWNVEQPGLSLITWPWRTGCPTRGCQDS